MSYIIGNPILPSLNTKHTNGVFTVGDPIPLHLNDYKSIPIFSNTTEAPVLQASQKNCSRHWSSSYQRTSGKISSVELALHSNPSCKSMKSMLF